MKTKIKECTNCPFKRTQEWRGGWVISKMSALMTIEESGNIFSCHMKHPNNNVFSRSPMIENDCVGFAKMLENMNDTNKHSQIVNNFLETNPSNYDFIGWAKSEGKNFKLLKGLKNKYNHD